MQRAMARQAEAERERRAKVINAEGEYQASERLKDAAIVIEAHPIALQLRYLQTLLELGSSQSTTIVFPAPIDLLQRVPRRRSRAHLADLRHDPPPGAGSRSRRRAPTRPAATTFRVDDGSECPFCAGNEAPDAAGDAPARRRADRLGRSRRAEPLSGARAPGGRGARPRPHRARSAELPARHARTRRGGVAAASARRRRELLPVPERGQRRRRVAAAFPLAARLAPGAAPRVVERGCPKFVPVLERDGLVAGCPRRGPGRPTSW